MVLICISLIISDFQHLLMFLLAICMSSFGKMPIQVLCIFFNWVVWFFVLSCMSSLYILDISPLSDIWLQISSPIQCVAFLFWWWFTLLWRNFLVLVSFVIFAFVYLAFGVRSIKRLLRLMLMMLLHMFSSRNFMVSGLTFKLLIHFELILCIV